MSQPPKPTLEERLEALAQSLELLYRDKQQDAAAIHDLALAAQRHDAQIAQQGANIDQLAAIARDALASVQSLERIATAYQRRLDGHEERIEDVEK